MLTSGFETNGTILNTFFFPFEEINPFEFILQIIKMTVKFKKRI